MGKFSDYDDDDDSDDWADIDDCEVVKETERGLCVAVLGEEFWLGKALVHADSEVRHEGDTGTLKVAQWWAHKNGLDE